MVITQDNNTVDLVSGKSERIPGMTGGKGSACTYYTGNAHVFGKRAGSAAYADVDNGIEYRLGGIRPGCMNTMMPADGILNFPYFARNCSCGLNIRTSLALIYMPELKGTHLKSK
jgi:hypothetical protein